MTRDTKVGLVVAGSFICLVAIVVATKFQGETAPQTQEVADAGTKDEAKDKEKSREKSGKHKDSQKAANGANPLAVRQVANKENRPEPSNPPPPMPSMPDLPSTTVSIPPPPNQTNSDGKDDAHAKMMRALEEEKRKEKQFLAMSNPASNDFPPSPVTPVRGDGPPTLPTPPKDLDPPAPTPLPPAPTPQPAAPTPQPPAPTPQPPGQMPAPPSFPAGPDGASRTGPGNLKTPPDTLPGNPPPNPLPLPGAVPSTVPPPPAAPQDVPAPPSIGGSPGLAPPPSGKPAPVPPPNVPAKTNTNDSKGPPMAAPPANPVPAPLPLGPPPSTPGLDTPIPVMGAPQPPPPPPPPDSPKKTPVVAPLGQDSTAAKSQSSTQPPPIGGLQPTPLGADTAPSSFPAAGAAKVKEINLINHVCAANENTFTAISLNVWGTEKFGPALAKFNESVQKKPIPGHTVLIPPIAFLEKEFASAIGGGSALPLGSERPVQSNSIGFPPRGSDTKLAGPDPMLPFNPNTLPQEKFNRSPGPEPIGKRPDAKPPQSANSAPANADGSKKYRVPAQGEMIIDIAFKTLGNRGRWPEIYRLNGNVEPQYPIPGGTELNLPASAVVPAQ